MPEIWENPFANAHLKVERANKHIAAIEERLRASSDNYGLVNVDRRDVHVDLLGPAELSSTAHPGTCPELLREW
jgi:hypothetical protein